MIRDTEKIIDSLLGNITKMSEVQSVGISGSKSPLPKAGEGDIDVFIYCDRIPEIEKRQAAIDQMGDRVQGVKINILEKGHWGTGDFVFANSVETWLMYFTVNETLEEVEGILNGEYPDKLDNYYYPIGRCAMFKNMNILYDKTNFLGLLKERLAEYPNSLAKLLSQHHLEKLEDTEDLERAVMRKDLLFYHFAMDLSVDHFLQALFAMNKTFFPSRKRSLELIDHFDIKPERCGDKILEVLRLGSCPKSINQSYGLWRNLLEELKALGGS
jgi:hypothetical protein